MLTRGSPSSDFAGLRAIRHRPLANASTAALALAICVPQYLCFANKGIQWEPRYPLLAGHTMSDTDDYFGPAGPPPPSGDTASIEEAVREQRERRAIAEVSGDPGRSRA